MTRVTPPLHAGESHPLVHIQSTEVCSPIFRALVPTPPRGLPAIMTPTSRVLKWGSLSSPMSRLQAASVENPLDFEPKCAEGCDSPSRMHEYPHTCLASAIVGSPGRWSRPGCPTTSCGWHQLNHHATNVLIDTEFWDLAVRWPLNDEKINSLH